MEYLNVWILVVVAGLLGTLSLFFATRGTRETRWPWLVSMVRLLPAVVLLTPAPIPDFSDHLAPAFIVVLFEGVFQANGAPDQAIALLAGAIVVLLVLVSVVHWIRPRRTPAQPQS